MAMTLQEIISPTPVWLLVMKLMSSGDGGAGKPFTTAIMERKRTMDFVESVMAVIVSNRVVIQVADFQSLQVRILDDRWTGWTARVY
jgi:hypothetical protein